MRLERYPTEALDCHVIEHAVRKASSVCSAHSSGFDSLEATAFAAIPWCLPYAHRVAYFPDPVSVTCSLNSSTEICTCSILAIRAVVLSRVYSSSLYLYSYHG